MQPNLFRSISLSLAEQFPLLPRIRRSFIGLLLFCLLMLFLDLSGDKGISVNVQPTDTSPYLNRNITAYPGGTVHLQGQLTITHPTLTQTLLFPGNVTGLDIGTLLCLTVACVIIIFTVPKLGKQHLFRKDITDSFRLLGFLLMFHAIFSLYRTISYLPEEVEQLTNHAFTSIRHFPLMIWLELYVSLILLVTASLYKKGIRLQEEQDLTI